MRTEISRLNNNQLSDLIEKIALKKSESWVEKTYEDFHYYLYENAVGEKTIIFAGVTHFNKTNTARANPCYFDVLARIEGTEDLVPRRITADTKKYTVIIPVLGTGQDSSSNHVGLLHYHYNPAENKSRREHCFTYQDSQTFSATPDDVFVPLYREWGNNRSLKCTSTAQQSWLEDVTDGYHVAAAIKHVIDGQGYGKEAPLQEVLDIYNTELAANYRHIAKPVSFSGVFTQAFNEVFNRNIELTKGDGTRKYTSHLAAFFQLSRFPNWTNKVKAGLRLPFILVPNIAKLFTEFLPRVVELTAERARQRLMVSTVPVLTSIGLALLYATEGAARLVHELGRSITSPIQSVRDIKSPVGKILRAGFNAILWGVALGFAAPVLLPFLGVKAALASLSLPFKVVAYPASKALALSASDTAVAALATLATSAVILGLNAVDAMHTKKSSAAPPPSAPEEKDDYQVLEEEALNEMVDGFVDVKKETVEGMKKEGGMRPQQAGHRSTSPANGPGLFNQRVASTSGSTTPEQEQEPDIQPVPLLTRSRSNSMS